MNRIELIEALAQRHELSKAEAGRVLTTLLDAIVATVKKGDSVSLVGFGTFKQSARAARTGRNPSTGATLKIAATKVPRFTAGAGFKAAVDPKAAARPFFRFRPGDRVDRDLEARRPDSDASRRADKSARESSFCVEARARPS